MNHHGNAKDRPTKNQTMDIPVQAVTYEEIDRLEKEVAKRFQEEVLKGTANPADVVLREASSLGQGGYGEVDEHSGSYAYNIKVNIPSPRNGGPKPAISIVYNSMRSGASSLIGMGWRLELGHIERLSLRGDRVDFKNNQGDDDPNDHFILKLNGKTYTMANVHGHPNQFRIKIEESFARAYRYLSSKIDPVSNEPEIDHWMVILADGTRYRYGVPNSAGQNEAPGELRNKIWNIIAIEDVYHRKVLYEYDSYRYKDNPYWEEMAYTYPVRVKTGVTADESFWDSIVEFVYQKKQPQDPFEGYYNLGIDYTGREYQGPKSGYTCMIWKQLTEIRTFYRDEKGNFAPNRHILINAKEEFGRFKVETIEEVAYKNRKVDTTAKMPPHSFQYEFKDDSNPALMKRSVSPMHTVEEMTYGLASQVDQGTPHAIDDTYLVVSYTESCHHESWTKTYQYWDGQNYTPFREFRGHRRSDVVDEETGMRTETYHIQTGVHNGSIREQIKYDTIGNKISHLENNWMALDYKGGRYMPFKQRSVTRTYAEDGATVLSTVVEEIPADDAGKKPWTYQLDQYGSTLVKIKTTYLGDMAQNDVVNQAKTETQYKNIEADEIRLIGLPAKTIEYVRSNRDQQFLLSKWEEKDYNDKGQVIETRKRIHRDDEKQILKETVKYHPITGKVTAKYRFNHNQKILVEKNNYYENGPYRFLKSHKINALEQVDQTTAYDLQAVKPSEVVRMNGTTAKTTYDGLDRTTSELFVCTDPENREGNNDSVTYTYTVTPEKRCTETHFIHTGARKVEHFDPLNRKFKELKTGYKGRWIVKEETRFHHKTRKPAHISEPYFQDQSSPSAHINAHIKEYDDVRLRLTLERFPGGKVVRTRYNGFVTTREEEVYQLDQDGNVGALLYTRLMEEETKNALDQIVKRSSGKPGSDGHYEIYLHYDAQGRRIKITDNLNILLTADDFASRLDDKPVSTTDAALGQMTMEYDHLGRVIRKRRDFKGKLDRIITLSYDHLDRIIKQSDQDTHAKALREMTCQFDSAANGIGKPAVRTVKETNDLGTYIHEKRFTYSPFGFPATETHKWDIHWPSLGIEKNITARTDFEHNGQKGGRLEFLSYPAIDGIEGGTAEYIYDDQSGLLQEICFNDRPVWQVPEGAYNARGKAETIVFGNGVKNDFLYLRTNGKLAGTDATAAGNILQQYRLQYDTSANVRQQHIKTAANGTNAQETDITNTYTYDDKNQLTTATLGDHQQSFKYKPNGSRINFQDNHREIGYQYNPDHPHRLEALTGSAKRQFTYDNAGNMVLDTNNQTSYTRSFKWNPANKLQQVSFPATKDHEARTLVFGYGGELTRVVKYDSATHTLVLYLDSLFELELNLKTDQNIMRSHIMNNSRRIATLKQLPRKPAATSYYHRDLLTSVILVTRADGTIQEAPVFEPFGKLIHNNGEESPDILYTGHRADFRQHLGFHQYDFKARIYDPELGLFLSPDEAQDPKNSAFGYNRYIYVNNNPISKWDPSGNQGDDEQNNGFAKIEHGFFFEYRNGWNFGPIISGYEIPIPDIYKGYQTFDRWLNSPPELPFDLGQTSSFGNNTSPFLHGGNQNFFNLNPAPQMQPQIMPQQQGANQNNQASPNSSISNFLNKPLSLSPQIIRSAFPLPFDDIRETMESEFSRSDRAIHEAGNRNRSMFDSFMSGSSNNDPFGFDSPQGAQQNRFNLDLDMDFEDEDK